MHLNNSLSLNVVLIDLSSLAVFGLLGGWPNLDGKRPTQLMDIWVYFMDELAVNRL